MASQLNADDYTVDIDPGWFRLFGWWEEPASAVVWSDNILPGSARSLSERCEM